MKSPNRLVLQVIQQLSYSSKREIKTVCVQPPPPPSHVLCWYPMDKERKRKRERKCRCARNFLFSCPLSCPVTLLLHPFACRSCEVMGVMSGRVNDEKVFRCVCSVTLLIESILKKRRRKGRRLKKYRVVECCPVYNDCYIYIYIVDTTDNSTCISHGWSQYCT